ncbi:MAG: hypothetical protein QM784_02360 [Polyangiaceae bacterium]
MAFFAVNIVIATMFMRWHWLVDVVAGLTLAAVALVLSVAVTQWDLRNERGTRRVQVGPHSAASHSSARSGRRIRFEPEFPDSSADDAAGPM